MKKLSKRAIASRANGAKSHGPVSIDGRRRSSANSLRHGFLAKCVVLDHEDKGVFSQFFDEHVQKLNPADGVEYAVVEEIVAAAWRLRRIWKVETTLLNKEVTRAAAVGPATTADAFTVLANTNQLQLLDRYETKLHRAYQRALNNLMLLRQFPRDEEPFPEPNEPIVTPAPGPAESPSDVPATPPSVEPKITESAVPPNEPKSPQPSANKKVRDEDDDEIDTYEGYPIFEINLGPHRP